MMSYELQIEWIDYHITEETYLPLGGLAKFEVIDYRNREFPDSELMELAAKDNTLFWAEGKTNRKFQQIGLPTGPVGRLGR